jgi:hypothetical protein
MSDPTTQPDRDPEIAQLARDHPGYQVWRGPSGTLYARPADDHPAIVHAQHAEDLSARIRRAEIRKDNQ